MVLENKLNITNSSELAREEERISKLKAIDLFENLKDFLPTPVVDFDGKKYFRNYFKYS